MKKFQRVISMLLITALLLSTIPLNTYAQELYKPPSGGQIVAVSNQYGREMAANSLGQGLYNSDTVEQLAESISDEDGLYNPNAKEQLIAALAEEYGTETAAAMVESMISIGIIDEDGNRLTYKIEMDGKLYTLDQMKDIVNSPDVDLTREVKVDGQAVPLAFIAKIIDFDKYMTFVEEGFLNNKVKLTDEHLQMLTDLEDQMANEGISLTASKSDIANVTEEVYGPEAADVAHTVYSIPIVQYSIGNISANNTVDITYTLSDEDNTDNTSVAFTQELLEGVLGTINIPAVQTITLTGSNPTQTVTINLPDTKDLLWNGDAALCYVHLKDLNGGRFSDGKFFQFMPIISRGNFVFTAYNGFNIVTNYPISPDHPDGWNITAGSITGGKIVGTDTNPDNGVSAWMNAPLKADGANLAENQELKVNASGSFWKEGSSGAGGYQIAYLTVKFNKGASYLAEEKREYRDAAQTWAQTLSFPNVLVPEDTTSMVIDAGNVLNQHDGYYNMVTVYETIDNLQVHLTDVKAPTVIGISSPDKTFKTDEKFPIVVTFSEPVKQAGGLTLTLKDEAGRIYQVTSENLALTNSKITFMFDIPAADKDIAPPLDLYPVSISAGISDTSGNGLGTYNFPNGVNMTHPDWLTTQIAYNELDSLEGLELKDATGNALASSGVYSPEETQGSLEIPLFKSNKVMLDGSTLGQRQNEWLINNTTKDAQGKFTVDKLYASYDNGATKIPLYITDTVDKLTAEFNLPSESGNYRMLLYLAYDGGFRPIMEAGYSFDFVKGSLMLIEAEDFTINYPDSYPSGGDKVLNLGDTGVKLTYTYSGDATYQKPEDFKWVSSDKNIAAIDPVTGEITPVSVGTVTFELIAKNGKEDRTRDVTKLSDQFTVNVSLNTPTLAVSKFITTQRGAPVQVMWSTNVIHINQQAQKDTTFTVELYNGNYDSIEALTLAALTPTYTVTAAVDGNSITIPGEYFTKLSAGLDPAYTVKVTTDNPYDSGQKVAAVGNIMVTSFQANVSIERPQSYYILDTADPLTVIWTSMDVDTENGCDFEFAVSQNGDPIVTRQETSGSYAIDFRDVTGRLKDVYTVTAKIKNTGDEAYSYDSFVLHVYDADAMKIWVDKQDQATLTMDNEPAIAGMTSEEIIALERDITLTNKLSINYGDYSYGLVTDQIEWKSSKPGIASINYTQGGRYDKIENYDLLSYMPNTNFILAGLNNGTTTINATHKLSRMTDALGVEVKTLKDKLYLFQVMPMVKTEFVYTDGDGTKETVYSDDKGAVAIYEPNGIKSDVNLKSTMDDSTYLGTIYHYNLLSGENDGSQGLLYPINNFELRKAAQMDLNFKKPDGTPYTGTVSIRGGVYKNSNYCETSEISDNNDVWKNTVAINPVKGFYRLDYDITRFWSAAAGETSADSVNATDKIDYVFEFHYGNDDYQPQIMKFSGNLSGADALRFGDSIVNLVSIIEKEKNQPFFAAQYLDRYKKSGRLDYIKNCTENIGINAQIPKIEVYTQALWWGTPLTDTNASVSILNEAGAAITGQSYKTFKYPFATMLVTEHQMVIDKNNIWLDLTGRGRLTVKLFNADGTLYNSTLAPYSIRNLLEVVNVSDSSDVNEKFQQELKDSIKAGASFDKGDGFVQNGLDFVSGIKFGNDNFSLIIAPTADPTVFSGLLQLNQGEDIMEGPGEEDEFSLMLEDDEVDKIGVAKAGFAKARELNSSMEEDQESLKEEAEEAKKDKKDRKNGKFDYQVGGYLSCKVYYNFKTQKWEVCLVGGGIRAGIRYKWSKTGNTTVGGVPVTYEIELGAAARVDFDAHMLYDPVTIEGSNYQWRHDNYESVTDYLTNLRVMAYIYAFGGLGFDATVTVLKIGPFGQLTLQNQNKFLNRPYLAKESDRAINGSMLGLEGKVGIKFEAKVLLVWYRKTLASASFSKEWTYRNWDKIEAYWKETTGDMLTPGTASLATRLYAAATGQDTITVSEAPAVESRDYLNDYTRTWGTPGGTRHRLLALDSDNLAPSTLQSNAYPYANPLIADDGSMFVYLSDNDSPVVWATTASYAVNQNGSYVDRGTINEAQSFGDSGLSLASRNGLAVSAWVRLRDKLEKNADDEISKAEISMMTNNAEIYASIFNGGSWTNARLTDNGTPDLAPVVATNGNKAIVAWRSVYAGDAENPTDFSGKDTIVYSIYDGSNWSETRTLYNGISGSVVGLKAAMLSDGTAAITYIIDTSKEGDINSCEVVYGVVAASGDIVNNVRLTNDDTSDKNPQLTVTNINDEERFILGWYKTDEEKSDVRLATFGNDGSPKEDFIDSLYAVSSGSNVGSNFKFANTSKNNQDINNLSILWTEYDSATFSDSLKAIKFVRETVDGTEFIFTTSAIDVAEMPANTVIDSFDAYVADAASDEVKVIILGTEAKEEYETITDEDGNTIEVPKTESKMFTATESYRNKAEITAADFDYTEIMAGFIMPITFTVQNQGKELITSVTIQYGNENKTFDDLKILPGTGKTLVVYYNVPEDITDLDYSGTATFGDAVVDMTGSDTLALALSDVGISKINTIKEMDGQREFAVTLYNSSDYKLSTSGKTVKLAIYDNSAYTTGTEVADVVTISDTDELSLVDNGAYMTNLSFDIKSYLGKNEHGTPAEIPENGVTLYAKVWVEDSSGEELDEFVGENNFKTIVCPNMVKRNGGNPIKVEAQQSNSASQTTAVLTLQNLAMAPVAGGNVAVNLLDEGGNIIETQYLSNTAEGLVILNSEAAISKTFVFNTAGADVEAYYFTATADSMNADLQILAASGIGLEFDKDTTAYDNLKANSLQSTNITAISANPNAKVSLMDASDTVLAEETGAVAYTLPLAAGGNTFKVAVEPESAGAQPKTYALTVANAAPASGSVTLSASAPGTRGWWNSSSIPVALTATDVANFTPANMQYKVNDGDWTRRTYTGSPIEVASITEEGTHIISARLQDVNDSNLKANSLTVKVDRTAPAFVSEQTSATLTGNTCTVSTDVTDALSGIYSLVMTAGGTAYPMQKQGDTNTYTANIAASSIGYIAIVATDMAGNTAQTSIGNPVGNPVTSITISAANGVASVANGSSLQMSALVLPPDADDATLTWSVENGTGSANISATGLLAGIAVGTVTVKATAYDGSGVSGTKTITIVGASTGGRGGDSSAATNIDLARTTDNTNSVKLTATEVNAAKTLTVNGNGIRLMFSKDMLVELKVKSSLEVIINPIKTGELSAAARAIVGDRPVFNIQVLADGNTISNVNLYIEIPYMPKEGENTSKLAAFYISNDGTITQMEGSRYDREKQAIVFTTTHLSMYAVGQTSEVVADRKFMDVLKSSWAESSIYYLVDRGIVNGKSETTFAPDDNITRAEFVTILAKMSGNTLPQGTDEFSDIQANAWFAQYVTWASQAGLAKGYNGNFNPNDFISRQDIAAMITRYAENIANYTLPASTVASTFTDDAAIASYAKKAVYDLQQAGIISGRGDNSFAPNAYASRAEAAKIIAGFLQGMSN